MNLIRRLRKSSQPYTRAAFGMPSSRITRNKSKRVVSAMVIALSALLLFVFLYLFSPNFFRQSVIRSGSTFSYLDIQTVSLNDSQPESSLLFNRPLVFWDQNFTQLSFNMPYEEEWRQHPHLVVYGVLATDKPDRRVIRNLQRSTWLRYPDVATRRNAFNGLLLMMYPTAPSASIAPNITVDMLKEMNDHHDVLLLRMKEEAPTESKTVGEKGYYGLPFHISNTRKLLMYLLYAHYVFPTTPFIAKGDDDSFVYIPEYMRMVMQLPRINLVYGPVSWPFKGRRFPIAFGYSYLITRDVLRDTVNAHDVYALLSDPYGEEHTNLYNNIGFHAEDWMVGVSSKHLYGMNTLIVREMPPMPPDVEGLPEVVGWGKHYMDYIHNPHEVPHGGRAVSSDGRYNMTYTFPPPSELRPGNVLWVNDRCRIRNQRWPNTTVMRPIVAHRPITEEQFTAYWEYYHKLGDDAFIARPAHIEVAPVDVYFNAADLWGILAEGQC